VLTLELKYPTRFMSGSIFFSGWNMGLRAILFVVVCVTWIGTTSRIYATNYYWDGGSANIPENGNGASEGAQTSSTNRWSIFWANWDIGNVPHVAWPTTGLDNDAIFDGNAGEIGLSDNIVVNDIYFNSPGLRLLQGLRDITLNGVTPTITMVSGADLRLGANIRGNSGLTKAGPGSLYLGSFYNDYTGGTFINQGTLAIPRDSAFGALPSAPETNITINGGTLQFDGGFTLHANRQIAIGVNGATFLLNSFSNQFYAGVIKDAAPGSGSLTLMTSDVGIHVPQAQNTYTGGTKLVSGITVPQVSSIGSASTNDLISGPYGVGTLSLEGGGMRAASMSSNTVGNALELRADTNFVMGSATETLSFSGPLTLKGNYNFLAQNSSKIVFSGLIKDDGLGYSLNLDPASTATSKIELSAVNTYSGGTNIQGGILALSGNGKLGPGNIAVNSTLDVTGISAATYGFTNTQTVSGSGTILAIGKLVTIDGTLAPGNSPGILTVTGNLGFSSTTNSVFEIQGSASNSYDQLKVSGSLLYDGTLSIVNNQVAGSFDLFDFGSLSAGSDFDAINLTGLYTGTLTPSGLGNNLWSGVLGTTTATFDGTTGVLTLTAIPEPSSVLIIGLITLGVVTRCRLKHATSGERECN
jgi:autotransporter-associated beta strand protein